MSWKTDFPDINLKFQPACYFYVAAPATRPTAPLFYRIALKIYPTAFRFRITATATSVIPQASQPTQLKCIRLPLAVSFTTSPDKKAAMPALSCCTDELMLMKLPRNFGSTLDVISDMAGTKRAPKKIKKIVVTTSAL